MLHCGRLPAGTRQGPGGRRGRQQGAAAGKRGLKAVNLFIGVSVFKHALPALLLACAANLHRYGFSFLQAVPQQTFTRLDDSRIDGLESEALKGEGQVIAYYHNAGECCYKGHLAKTPHNGQQVFLHLSLSYCIGVIISDSPLVRCPSLSCA